MPTYAILGATGNCGTALLDHLSRHPTAKVHAYCRDKAKLLNAIPQLADNKRVDIFQGSIHDVSLLSRCIKDTHAIFHVVSTNTNVPNCQVGLDTARSIVSALKRLKSESPGGGEAKTTTPKLVLLSSATIDDHLSRGMSPWFRRLLLTSASNVYADLRRTEEFLRAEEDTVVTVFVKPGGLSVDGSERGCRMDFDEHEAGFVSYLDLAAAMIAAADDETGRYDMRNVGVVNVGRGARMPAGTIGCILTGLLRHFFPFLHGYLPTPGPG